MLGTIRRTLTISKSAGGYVGRRSVPFRLSVPSSTNASWMLNTPALTRSFSLIHECLFGDVELEPNTAFTDYVFRGVDPTATAFIDGTNDRAITFEELQAQIDKAAKNLIADGFQAGDVLAIHMANCPEYAVAFHAVASLGGSCTTVGPLASADEMHKQLEDSQARYVLTSSGLQETAEKAAQRTSVERVYVLGSSECFLSKENDDQTELILPSFDPKEQVIALPYSSGTTGLPKGTMLTHYNLTSNLAQTCNNPEFSIGYRKGDRVLAVLPFFHIYGMVVLMSAALKRESTVVTLPYFEPESFLETISRHRITTAAVVPPMARFLAKHPMVDSYDLDSVEELFSAAAPLDAGTEEAVAKRLPRARVSQGYGLTETSPVTHFPRDYYPKRGSIGFLAPNCKCKIVDPSTKQLLPPGRENVGELCIQGPNVMKGYLNNEKATKEAIDEDGFLCTGDLGYVDESGHYFIVDRIKELIKVKGFQVPPAELEGILLEHDEIIDAAVVGIEDERAGEVPKAFIVKTNEACLSEDDVKRFVAERVAEYKQLQEVEFIEEVPKSPAGKILRRHLKKQ